MAKEKSPKNKKNNTKSKGHKTRNIILLVFGILFIFALAFGYWLYRTILSSNVNTGEEKEAVIYIPTGSDFDAVMDTLNSQGLLIRENSFRWVADLKKISGKHQAWQIHRARRNEQQQSYKHAPWRMAITCQCDL